MKKFETPVVDIEKLEVADVITTSDEPEPTLGDNQTPFG